MKRIKWYVGAAVFVASVTTLLLIGKPAPADACGSRKVIQENLRLAAEKRPVAEWVIYTDRDNPWKDETTASEGTLNSLRDLTGRSDEQLREMVAKGKLSYAVEQGRVTVTWTVGPFQKEPMIIHSNYRFPTGPVRAGDEIGTVIAQLRIAHEARQVQYFSVMTFRNPLDEWDDREYNRGTLQNTMRAFGDGKEVFPCVEVTLSVAGADFSRPLTLPMLQVGRGRYVGFSESKIITHYLFEGWDSGTATTRWYPFP